MRDYYDELVIRWLSIDWNKLPNTWENLLGSKERNLIREKGTNPPDPTSKMEEKLRLIDKYEKK